MSAEPTPTAQHGFTPFHWFMSSLIAVCGGVGGALFVWRSFPLDPFDWGTFLGSLVAASAAVMLAKLGLREYFQRQERDEVSRRWIDDGITQVGRLLVGDFERCVTNWTVCTQLIEAACSGASKATLELLANRLDPHPPAMTYEHRRIVVLLDDDRLLKSMASFYGHVRLALILFASAAPAAILSYGNAPSAERDESLRKLREKVDKQMGDLETLCSPLLTEFVYLAHEFECLGLRTHQDVLRAGQRLKPSLDRLAGKMGPALSALNHTSRGSKR